MTTKEHLIEQFTACYDENGWFVALKNALNNLTAEQAARKTENIDNSIREILAHLNFYNERYLQRFKGEAIAPQTIGNDATFAGSDNVSEEDWQAEIEKFDAIMLEWRSLLESSDENKFNESVSAANKSQWSTVVGHINIHNAHHGGQIVLIRKIQGSWDASKGVS